MQVMSSTSFSLSAHYVSMDEQEVFKFLEQDLLSEVDNSDLPVSSLYWDGFFRSIIAEYGINPQQPYVVEKALQGGGRSMETVDGVGACVSFPLDRTQGLLGLRSSAPWVVMNIVFDIQDMAQYVFAWVAVSRGGQRWARLGHGDAYELFDLNADYLEGVTDRFLRQASSHLEYASRMLQIYLNYPLPAPAHSPLHIFSSVIARRLVNSFSGHSHIPERRLVTDAAAAMRVAAIKLFVQSSRMATSNRMPVEALVRLDTKIDLSFKSPRSSVNPGNLSGVLGPAVTATLQEASSSLSLTGWSDIEPGDLLGLTGLTSEQADWWGVRGVAYRSEQLMGTWEDNWLALRELFSPEGFATIRGQAIRLGLPVPDISVQPVPLVA